MKWKMKNVEEGSVWVLASFIIHTGAVYDKVLTLQYEHYPPMFKHDMSSILTSYITSKENLIRMQKLHNPICKSHLH